MAGPLMQIIERLPDYCKCSGSTGLTAFNIVIQNKTYQSIYAKSNVYISEICALQKMCSTRDGFCGIETLSIEIIPVKCVTTRTHAHVTPVGLCSG